MSNFIESLYISEYDKLVRFAFSRLRNSEDAEDAVQSVFLACLQYPQKIEEADQKQAYLMHRRNETGFNLIPDTPSLSLFDGCPFRR
jgi:hypothetical protein